MNYSRALACCAALLLCSAQVVAAPLDCGFKQHEKAYPTSRESRSNVAFQSFQLNTPMSVKPGGIVLRRETTDERRYLTVAQAVKFKPDWFLSPRYSLKPGTNYPVQRVTTPRGDMLALVKPSKSGNEYLFFDEQGNYCDRALTVNRNMGVMVIMKGVYAANPPDVQVDYLWEKTGEDIGEVIVLDQMDAASFTLSRRRTQGATVGDPMTQNFNKFARSFEFAGYGFAIDNVAADAVTLRVVSAPGE